MLRYLYSELQGKRFRNIDITEINTLDDLYALIISRWCASLAKEGLYKEYVSVENEEMTSPRGQISIQETLSKQTQIRGALICSYDELSENIYINHILKGTLQYILFDNKIDKMLKTETKKAIQLFNGVEYTDINFVQWKSIKFNNSNMRYKHLMELCNAYVTEHKLENQLELNDDKRLYLLFKKQIIKWFKQVYGKDDNVDLYEVAYTSVENEPQFEVQLLKNQKIVLISNENQALMISIRLIDEHIMDNVKLKRKQMEEMVFHMREYRKLYKIKPSSCIFYVNTDKNKLNIEPLTVNVIDDYAIGESTIDIHDQWRFIENKLKDAYKYFIFRGKKDKNKKIIK